MFTGVTGVQVNLTTQVGLPDIDVFSHSCRLRVRVMVRVICDPNFLFLGSICKVDRSDNTFWIKNNRGGSKNAKKSLVVHQFSDHIPNFLCLFGLRLVAPQ